ncbi:MAG: glycosyltransferase family 2 protein [Saprospiraceae bacterium]|nr:glycosyltransferase family 2 protein [Saprospiraceae bacterium]
MKVEYSIVIPIYNSEASLTELLERIHSTMQSIHVTFEVVCVNDCSQDRSWAKLKTLKKKYFNTLKIVSLSKNFGQHSALFCGFTYAKGGYVLTIDDDLQHAPEDIPLLIEKAKNAGVEVVYGISKEKKGNLRKFFSWLWKFSAKFIDNGLGKGSAFRMINSRVKNAIIKHPQGIIFIDEIIQWHTHAIGFVKISHYPRKYGQSNYSSYGLFKFITNVSFNYSTVPLRLMSLAGGLISCFTFLLGLWFIFKKIYFGVEVKGFTALIVTILFSSSLLLMGIGLLGRYLNQIFILLNNKPSFSVSEEEL